MSTLSLGLYESIESAARRNCLLALLHRSLPARLFRILAHNQYSGALVARNGPLQRWQFRASLTSTACCMFSSGGSKALLMRTERVRVRMSYCAPVRQIGPLRHVCRVSAPVLVLISLIAGWRWLPVRLAESTACTVLKIDEPKSYSPISGATSSGRGRSL